MHVPGDLIRRMNGAVLAANQQPCSNTCSMQAAFAILDNLIKKMEENTASQKRQAWKRNFKTFSQSIWKPAKMILKDPQLNSSFSAHDA